ncbi:MAG: hypothetical protein ABS81_12155 [Pseudonocardia sp. SCN 72-86]|nr:MAG: hypothetical protein ABS81_12155 [Pseudonocardia sp. SCN 72-86]
MDDEGVAVGAVQSREQQDVVVDGEVAGGLAVGVAEHDPGLRPPSSPCLGAAAGSVSVEETCPTGPMRCPSVMGRP